MYTDTQCSSQCVIFTSLTDLLPPAATSLQFVIAPSPPLHNNFQLNVNAPS